MIQQKEAPERHEELFQAEDNEVEMGDATLEQLEEARDSATSELTNLDSIGPMTRKKAARMGELQTHLVELGQHINRKRPREEPLEDV